MTQNLNFPAVANNDEIIEATITKKSDGSLVDLTTAYIKVSLYAPNSSTVILSYDTTGGGVVIDNQTTNKGKFQFTLVAADTKNFAAGDYKWDAVTVIAGRALSLKNNDPKLTSGTISLTTEVAVQP